MVSIVMTIVMMTLVVLCNRFIVSSAEMRRERAATERSQTTLPGKQLWSLSDSVGAVSDIAATYLLLAGLERASWGCSAGLYAASPHHSTHTRLTHASLTYVDRSICREVLACYAILP